MEKNNVWKVTSKQKVPSDRRVLGTKWVFKVKKNGVFMARLVAQGYAQIPGIDHKDNFSPVIYKTTFRLILVLWATYNWEAEIIDIETAFLYGDLEEEIYLRVPERYREYSTRHLDGEACLLLDHAIYGLVQAAHQFFKKLVEVLVGEMKFKKCLNDPCLLMKENENGVIIICLYIDDTLCVGNAEAIRKFKKEIKKYFVTKEEGFATEYVGCMIKRAKGRIYSHQSDLIKKIERHFGKELENIRDYKTPATPGQGTVRVNENDVCLTDREQFKYRSAVGMMLFLVKYSSTDISNSVRELSKANNKANYAHYKQMLRFVKYVIN